jgi:hypothetical protein
MQVFGSDIEVLDAYYYHGEYNSAVSNNIFGVVAGYKYFYVDFGYRDYYQYVRIADTFTRVDTVRGYDDTFFLKITATDLVTDLVSLYFDKNSFPLPDLIVHLDHAGQDYIVETNLFSIISTFFVPDDMPTKRMILALKIAFRR